MSEWAFVEEKDMQGREAFIPASTAAVMCVITLGFCVKHSIDLDLLKFCNTFRTLM